MRRTAHSCLFLALFMTLTTPGFAQVINDPPEYEAYMKVFNEKDPVKMAAAGEKFLVDYPKTTAITQTYMFILLSHHEAKNWPKALEWADKHAQVAPTLPADDKKRVLIVGMTAAEQTNNKIKLKSYAEKALENDPKNPGALVTLSGLLANNLPSDQAGILKQLDETLVITKRALAAIPRPGGTADAAWIPILVQLHDTSCMVLFNQKKYAEAIAECDEALKLNKKDGDAYYLKGIAMKPAVKGAIDKYTAAVDKLNLPENRTADQLTRDELTADAQGLLSAATTRKDDLAEVFAKAVACGGANAAEARKELMQVFTGSPVQLDTLIQAKKTELGITN